jgi:hypothetical protein
MARIVLSTVIIVLLSVSFGCQQADSGRGMRISNPGTTAIGTSVSQAGETDIVEQIAINRRAYQQGLELLIRYYNRTGNTEPVTI